MNGEIISDLIRRCKAAQSAGASPNEIRDRVLPGEVKRIIEEIKPQDFLDWVKEDREFSYYYFDAQQSGACRKPAEAVAMILESIALDALE